MIRSCEICEHWEARLRRCTRGVEGVRVDWGCWQFRRREEAPPGDCPGQRRMFEE